MKTLKYLTFGLAALGLIVGCDKDEDDDPTPTNTKKEVHLHISHEFDGNSFALDQNFSLGTGEVVKFSTAQFYASNPSLMDDDQVMEMLDTKHMLITPSVTDVELGETEAGHKHMFMINLGIDSLTNATVQPSDISDVDDPLGAQLNSMWWSWAAGYMFLKFEGEIDYDGDNTFDASFEYHIGTNAFYTNLSEMIHTDVEQSDTHFDLEMEVDYAKIFDQLDLMTELKTKTMNNMPLAIKIADNFESAIELEAGHH